jgi:hypothetical protein
MRSTQKRVRELYREVRLAIGARTNAEACEHIAKAEAFYEKRLAKANIKMFDFTAYAGNDWSISATIAITDAEGNNSACICRKYYTTEQWMDCPTDTLKDFIQFNGDAIKDYEKAGYTIRL